jgi:hypothetical protein
VDHLEDEGAAGAHLDLADVEAEAEEGLQEGALPIRLTANRHDLRDGKLLSERHRRRLQPIVRLEPRLRLRCRHRRRGSCSRRIRGCTAGGGGRGRRCLVVRGPPSRRRREWVDRHRLVVMVASRRTWRRRGLNLKCEEEWEWDSLRHRNGMEAVRGGRYIRGRHGPF